MAVDDNHWPEDDPETLESFLYELFHQLKGLIHHPALPAGMRLADHPEYGRVVVSSYIDDDGDHLAIGTSGNREDWLIWRYLETESLTFLDSEPSKPARPEFLETVDDYVNAPQRTIVAKGDAAPWVKLGEVWETAISQGRSSWFMGDAPRRVLRWGDK